MRVARGGGRHALVGALALFAACGPLAQPAPPPYPINECGANPCSAYAGPTTYGCLGGAGACQTSDVFEIVILVSVPETRVNPGFTIATRFSDFFQDAIGGSPSTCGDPRGPLCLLCASVKCVPLPTPTLQQGTYQVTPELLRQVHATLGDTVTTSAAIPASAIFRPLWSDGGSLDTATDAARRGIPLLPTFTSKDLSPSRVFPWAGGAKVIGWRAGLMPGFYERTVMPDPPFDAVFPPEITTVQVAQNGVYDRVVRGVDYPDDDTGAQIRTTVVSRNGADPSMEGWSVYLRDAISGARLSQRASLHGTGGQVTLHTLGLKPLATPARSAVLVVEPPADAVGIPTFEDNVLADVVPRPTRYPEVPPPVLVTGRVATSSGGGVRAQLIFRDSRDDTGSGRLLTSPTDVKSAPFIHYEHRETTDPQGGYVAVLPPGDYDVLVLPDDAPRNAPDDAPLLASAQLTLKVAGPPQPGLQQGKNLVVEPRVVARGSCVLTDGRPLAGVEVVATPSTDAAGAAPLYLRRANTMTDARGAYALALDPGVYDFTVRPPVASSFPWKVSTSHRVAAGSPPLDPIRVPPPSLVEARLLDGRSLELANAIVRAFAVPTRAGATGTVAVPIGEWATSGDGILRMWLTRPE